MSFYSHGTLINPDDQLNLRNERNRTNTQEHVYNCAGWALETFSWYCPEGVKDGVRDWDKVVYGMDEVPLKTRARILLNQCVGHILEDFKGRVRRIKFTDPIASDEYRIAFRLEKDIRDFHFMKEEGPDVWSSKAGGMEISLIPTEKLFKPWKGYINYYNRKIVFFAVKRV